MRRCVCPCDRKDAGGPPAQNLYLLGAPNPHSQKRKLGFHGPSLSVGAFTRTASTACDAIT